MKIAAISDVHVKRPHDEADRLLCRFLTHAGQMNVDYVVLLGDIFDLMCGPHPEYLDQFSHIFDLMDGLHKKGTKVLFFEGNHDVHLAKLFKLRWPQGEIVPHQTPVVETIEGKTYYFSHGDEHEVDNLKYQRYKALIMTAPLRFVANRIMPFRLLNYLGERASKMSRKRGSKTYEESKVKERFRKGVQETTKGKYDFVLGGHSHVKDQYQLNESALYLNNGYALKSESFILIADHQVSFPAL